MDHLTCRMKEYIQPFERRLALQEIRALAYGPVTPIDGDDTTALVFSVSQESDVDKMREELAYWHSIGDGASGLTAQLRGEATLGIARNGTTDRESSKFVRTLVPSKLPNRRCLRYATHGLHEYRGKFFPQLVRALINIIQLPENAIVLDPMCGSGTTLVEALLSERKAYGLDMNPLSAFISDVKCRALALKPAVLEKAYDELRTSLAEPELPLRESRWSISLNSNDQAYLARWFAFQTLMELDRIEAAVRRLSTETIRRFYRVCLSNILRSVSWQKNDDLRIRREQTKLAPGEVIRRFLDEADRSTRIVATFLIERGSLEVSDHTVLNADARQATSALSALAAKADVIITSPPYATALPYIDTDRLSLIYLGLLPRGDHRMRDMLMIGNREITKRIRSEYWKFYEKNRSALPRKTRAMIERIDSLNKASSVGFRRRNMSALLSNYFFDMRKVMEQAMALLKSGGTMFLVVGNNRTEAGGQSIDIQTAEHLMEIAKNLGFRAVDNMDMDMLPSRNIFRKNAVPSERIMRVEKP